MKNKEGGIGESRPETELDDKRCKPDVPGPWSLFQAVERFVE